MNKPLTIAAFDAKGHFLDMVEIEVVNAASVRFWMRHFQKLHADLTSIVAGSSRDRVFSLNARVIWQRDGLPSVGLSLTDILVSAYDARHAELTFDVLKYKVHKSRLDDLHHAFNRRRYAIADAGAI